MKLAFNVVWKSVALVIAGIVLAYFLILALVFVTGGGIGD